MVRDGKFLKEKHWTNCFPILVSIITYSKIIVFDLLEDQFVNHTCLFSDGRHLYQLIYERLSSKKQHVVSTGGGAVVLDENWDYMQKKGIVVWLDVPLEALARRIAAVGTHSRPLLHYEHGDPYTKLFGWELDTWNAFLSTINNVTPKQGCVDSLRWVGSGNPINTPKAYCDMVSRVDRQQEDFWKLIWQNVAPPRKSNLLCGE
ncbi:hypothetical protein V6N13_140251 [Hibiscus sabdariffa]